MVRVLHVYRTYHPDTKGGAQETIRQITRSTSALGIENRVFTPSENPDPKELLVENTPVFRVPIDTEIASCTVSLRGLSEFRRQADWADVIHYHFPWPFADFMHFYCRIKKPTVLTYHSDIVRQQLLLLLYGPLMRRFLEKMDVIVSSSPVYRDLSHNLRVHKDKVRVIPFGLDETSYPATKDCERRAVKSDLGEHFFLFVGVLRYYKGLHVLLDACQGQDFKVVIAGKGPMEKKLQQQAENLGLDNVVFLGEVSEDRKVALMQSCLAVVLPSHVRSEAFGISLLEGAMYGKPLISADTGSGTSFVNINGETGLVVPPEDADALTLAMQSLIANQDLVKSLGDGARKRFDALFSADLMGQRYVETYHQVRGSHVCESP